jgi:hypothetical protein
MTERRYRALLVKTRPVQYIAPTLRQMAKHPRLDIAAAYCSLQGAVATLDPDFGVSVAWDTPLLEGYRWVQVPNRSLRPGLGRFWGLVNPGIWKLIRSGKFDSMVNLRGYVYATFWIAIAAAKLYGTPVIFGIDAHDIAPRDGKKWKIGRMKAWSPERNIQGLFEAVERAAPLRQRKPS